jgi:AcrR family transcriptional regulator
MPRQKTEQRPEVTHIQGATPEDDQLPDVFKIASTKAPKTKRGERTQAKILTAARSVFARDGYTNARVTDITDAAEVALGTFYGYFDDKLDVFRAVVEPVVRELYRAQRSPYLDSDDPQLVLRQSLRQYMLVYYENSDVMRTLTEAVSVDPEFRALQFEIRSHFVQRIRRNLDRVSRDVPPLNSLLEASALGCMVENFCWVWFSMGGERSEGRPLLSDVNFDDMVEMLSSLFTAAVFGMATQDLASSARKTSA